MKVDNSRFFVIGAIGFFVGSYAWFSWIPTLSIHTIRSVSFLPFVRFFHILSVLSLALGSFGCFALKLKYRSDSALGCGILFLLLSAVLMYSLFLPTTDPRWYLHPIYNPVWLPNVGFVCFGATLLLIRKSLPNTKSVFGIGLIFTIISWFFLTFLNMVFLHDGFGSWIFILGLPYGISSVATALLMLQMRTYPDQPTPKPPAASSALPEPTYPEITRCLFSPSRTSRAHGSIWLNYTLVKRA